MVNIRYTLRKAERVGVISRHFRQELETVGKELFYPDRNYSLLVHHASDGARTKAEVARLRAWLPEGRVNQKRDDAIAMLRLIRRRSLKGFNRKKVSYSFEHTSMWEHARRRNGQHPT
jgi:hypothetical protein